MGCLLARFLAGAGYLTEGQLSRVSLLRVRPYKSRRQSVPLNGLGAATFEGGQTVAGWREELERAILRARDHLSLYQLTIEHGTMFERLRDAGKLIAPDNDRARALWDVTQEGASKAGLPAYEISNHARPGAESRHNLIYWRYGEYVGVGPGAHGRILTAHGRRAQATESHPEMWLTVVE